MANPPGNEPQIPREWVEEVAPLYSGFTEAMDPHDPRAEDSEKRFNDRLILMFDELGLPEDRFRNFRRAVITQCRRYLRSQEKPPSV